MQHNKNHRTFTWEKSFSCLNNMMLLLPIRRKEEKFCSHEWPANILWKKSSRHSYLRTQGAREGCRGTPEDGGFFFFFFYRPMAAAGPRVRRPIRSQSGIVLQGQGDWREGTFGSHYRTKGQGAGEQSESGSEVPDSPTGAVVNLHISTQEGASQSCLSTIHMCQQ